MHNESNDRYQTFIIVVVWFFVWLGAYTAIKSLGQLSLNIWRPQDQAWVAIFLVAPVSQLLFSTAALACGIGMLNRRVSALSNSVVLLWLYSLWHVGQLAWGLIKFPKPIAMAPDTSAELLELVQQSYHLGIARMISQGLLSIITVVVCIWLARRLSLPVFKSAYAKNLHVSSAP